METLYLCLRCLHPSATVTQLSCDDNNNCTHGQSFTESMMRFYPAATLQNSPLQGLFATLHRSQHENFYVTVSTIVSEDGLQSLFWFCFFPQTIFLIVILLKISSLEWLDRILKIGQWVDVSIHVWKCVFSFKLKIIIQITFHLTVSLWWSGGRTEVSPAF